MCNVNDITKMIHVGYLGVIIAIPLLYLIAYKIHKAKKKNYKKALVNAIIIGVVLYIPKLVGFILYDSCYNCMINGICVQEKKEDNDMDNEKTTTKVNTTAKPVVDTTPKTSKGFKIETIDGETYIDGILIVNKTYPLPATYSPKDPHNDPTGKTGVCNDCIDEEAYQAWTQMKADAAAVGLNLWIQSGYRPYSSQEKIYNSYVSKDGKALADTYSARPGYSEHQSGFCFDINNPSSSFDNTPQAKWINDNCAKYGFIIRFPKGKTNETGYKYESWHVRYVGKELANKLYNDGDWITLEDYFGITSEYKD